MTSSSKMSPAPFAPPELKYLFIATLGTSALLTGLGDTNKKADRARLKISAVIILICVFERECEMDSEAFIFAQSPTLAAPFEAD